MCNIRFLFAAFWIAVMSQARTTAISMEEYFPETRSNQTAVTWAHAVNSRRELEDAVRDKVMMLEADVVLGTMESAPRDLIPVMAHPPNNTSDLSLDGFLTAVATYTQKGHRCGIKLDFKTVEVLEPALTALQGHEHQINFPVMLNADILPGPVDSTAEPVNADTFLELCVRMFPTSTLSIGWTTRYSDSIFNSSYSEEHVKAMEEVLKRHHVKQPVTFPVRAVMAANSGATLARLHNSTPNSTFTIWSSDTDAVHVSNLREVILNILGIDCVYVDVPRSLLDELRLSSGDTRRTSAAPALLAMILLVACVST